MDAVDLNFTYSIVGPPQSVVLGLRAPQPDQYRNGVHISMRDARSHLSGSWLEWWVLRGGDDWAGQPRERPKASRLWLERHALQIAAVAAGVLLVELAVALAWGLRVVLAGTAG